MPKFRDLVAEEILVRVGSVSKNGTGLSLLLYKDARCDMSILDETVGAENWQREHYECKGNLFCRVGIKCGDEWIYKSDCGTESETEEEKGEASDSFKRACVNWGIGRELYTSPFMWVSSDKCEIKDGTNGRKKCDDKFIVESIKIEDKKIVSLSIYNATKKCLVFSWNKSAPKPYPAEQQTPKSKASSLPKALLDEAASLKIDLTRVAAYYHKTVEEITIAELTSCIAQKREALAKKGEQV